jgi:hypothetical protein
MSDTQQLTVVPSQEPSLGSVLQAVLDGGITEGNIATVRAICELKERMQAREAQMEFSAALAALQAATGTIVAQSIVKNKDGTVRYKYAKIEQIMQQARPHLIANGFSHSFDTVLESEGRITAIFKLTHKSGHSDSNRCTVRTSRGQGTNDSQDDMGVRTYAKRGALCDGLGIVISQDNDGADDHRMLGEMVDQDTADELRQGVKDSGRNEEAFLIYAGGVKCFEQISVSRVPDLREFLAKANRLKAKSAAAPAAEPTAEEREKLVAEGKMDKDGNFLF